MVLSAKLYNWCSRLEHRQLRKGLGMLDPVGFFNTVMARQAGWQPGITLSFDCDFPHDVKALPALVNLLGKYSCQASFACIGQWIQTYPEIHRQLVAAGHEIINHSMTHPNLYHAEYAYARQPGLSQERFNTLDTTRIKDEILQCHQTCLEILDYSPSGFRTPHFGELHSDAVYPILKELDYHFSSSTMAADTTDGLPWCRTDGIWEFPVSPCPRHPFGVFDSWHSLGKNSPSHATDGEFSQLFKILIERVTRDGGYANVYFDPFVMMETRVMEDVLQCIQASGLSVWCYGDLMAQLQDKLL